jgi:hypothetical protein
MGIVEGGTGNGRGQYSDVWTGKLIAPRPGRSASSGSATTTRTCGSTGSSRRVTPAATGARERRRRHRGDRRPQPDQPGAGPVVQLRHPHAEGGGGSELTLRWITPSRSPPPARRVATQVGGRHDQHLRPARGTGRGRGGDRDGDHAVINFQDNSKSELRYKVEQSRTADFAVVERTLSAPINGSSFGVTGCRRTRLLLPDHAAPTWRARARRWCSR